MNFARVVSALLWVASLSIATALVAAIAFTLSLPETDLARQGALMGVLSPFILLVALMLAPFGALEAYFLWLLLLRERSIERCAVIVFATVCIAILVTTPFLPGAPVFVPFAALPFGALLAQALAWTVARDDDAPILGRAR